MLYDSPNRPGGDEPYQLGPSQGWLIFGLAVVLLLGFAAYGWWGSTHPRSEIRVATDPSGATVVIDDWFRGETPFSQKLQLGSHKVVIRAAGREEERVVVALGAEPHEIRARLKARQPSWIGDE